MRIESFETRTLKQATIEAGGAEVAYQALFERAALDCGGELTAVSYVAESVAGTPAAASRPVAFVTNGGPGSSVAWLHLGFFGPHRIHLDDPLKPPAIPPFELEENPHCLLDACDLVLVDPAGCGISEAPDGEAAAELFSVDGDAHALALFIERWVDEHGRAQAPVYFIGESYGTVRACALADALAGGPFSADARAVGINLAGIVFMGTAISTASNMLEREPVEPSVLALPGCAATCAYHRPERLGSPREAYLAAWAFLPDYLRALFLGRDLEQSEREYVAARLEAMTAIPAAELLASGLRFDVSRVRASVAPGHEAGAYDGRYLMEGPAAAGSFPFPGTVDPVADDPAMGAYSPAFVGGMRVLHEELGLPEGTYRAIDFAVNGQWNYQSRHSPLASLQNTMRRNPSMRLLFASGIFDLVCHPAGVRHMVANSTLDPARTQVVEYESGHMPYLGETSATELEHDLRAFFQGAE